MATLETRANEQTVLTPRRDAAITTLAERRGVASPTLRLSRLSDLTSREQDAQVAGVRLMIRGLTPALWRAAPGGWGLWHALCVHVSECFLAGVLTVRR